jgi:hypothetical protein
VQEVGASGKGKLEAGGRELVTDQVMFEWVAQPLFSGTGA